MSSEYGRRANTRNQSLISNELVRIFEKIKECKQYKSLQEKLKRLDSDLKKTGEKSKKKKDDPQVDDDDKQQHSYMLKLAILEIEENINSYTPEELKNYFSNFFHNLLREIPENIKTKINEDCEKIIKVVESYTKEISVSSPDPLGGKRRNQKPVDSNFKGSLTEKKLKLEYSEENRSIKSENEKMKLEDISNQIDQDDVNGSEIKMEQSISFPQPEEIPTKYITLDSQSSCESPSELLVEESVKKPGTREKKEITNKEIQPAGDCKATPSQRTKKSSNSNIRKQKAEHLNSTKSKEDETFLKSISIMQAVHSKLNNLSKEKLQAIVKKSPLFSLEDKITEENGSTRVSIKLCSLEDYQNMNELIK